MNASERFDSLRISVLDQLTFPSSVESLKCSSCLLFIRRPECCMRINAPRKNWGALGWNQQRCVARRDHACLGR